MKKIVVWVSLLCMLIGLCACGTETSTVRETSLRENAYDFTNIYVSNLLRNRFREHTSYVRANITSFESTGKNEWKAYGKANFDDSYGDRYSGKWSGTVIYDTQSDSFWIRDFQSDSTFYRDR